MAQAPTTRLNRRIIAAALLGAVAFAQPALAQEGDAAKGRTLFQRQCQTCHQLAQPRNGVGPHLQGIAGKAAASVEGFNYSPALRSAGLTWTPENLNEYLTNPVAKVPGTRMVNRVPAEQDRRDIVAFLANP
jgi:cytochrome c